MRSKQLNLDAYETDKIRHGYLDVYDADRAPWIDKEITLLEIGVYRGGSLKLWRDYFPRGTIVGIDRKLPQHFRPGERIQRSSRAATEIRDCCLKSLIRPLRTDLTLL